MLSRILGGRTIWTKGEMPAMNMVLLDGPEPFDAEEAENWLRGRADPQATARIEDGSLMMTLPRWGEFMAVNMGSKLPEPDLVSAVEGSWRWDGAAGAANEHRSHAIVAGMGSDDPVHAHLGLSRVIGALTKTGRVVGVYRGQAQMLVEPTEWRRTVGRSTRSSLPLEVWIRPGRAPNGVRTFGASALGVLDAEVITQSPTEDDLALIFDFVHYALTADVEVRPGNTFGRSETDRRPIRVGRCRLGGGDRVVHLG